MSDAASGRLAKAEVIREEQGNHVREAVVFSDAAYVTRTARVQAAEGLNGFLLEVQAFDVDRHSAQSRVRGDGSILP